MLRVLIPVDHAVGISGPHRNVVGSLNALTARDDVTVVLVTGKVDPDEPYARSKNIDIRLGYHPHRPGKWLSNLRLLHTAAKGCDIIYVPTNLKSLLYAQSVRRPHRPLVAGPNVTHLPFHNKRDAPGTIELRWLSHAWFEASRARRDHVRRVSGNMSVTYIYHAIDTEKFTPTLRSDEIWARNGVSDASLKILYVGRDDALKGTRELLDAADILDSEGRSDLHFILVGSLLDSTQSRIRGMQNVTALGFRKGSDLSTLYASADVSIVPSSWEGFGFTVLEAMASGLPVIASRTGGIPEMIVDGESGILVELRGPDGNHRLDAAQVLAQAIVALVDAPARRRMLGVSARQRVEEHFTEKRLGDDLVALFASVKTDDPRHVQAGAW